MADETARPASSASTGSTEREIHRVTSADDRREQVEAEYGTWIAVEDIPIGTALAFKAGDAVPNSHVERGVVRPDQVAKRTTKAARTAVNAAAGLEE